jgi:hypothetical protein
VGISNQVSGWRTTALVLVIASATLVTSCASSVEPPPPAASPSPSSSPSPSPSPSASAGKTEVPPSEATAKIYVSPTGSDGSPGTQAAPLQSVERAAKMARPGTEVIFGDGTYTGSITTDVDGTADAQISFVSANRGGAKIVGDGSQDAAWQNNGDYVDIVGFDISGSNTDGLLSGGSFVRLIDNNVHGFHAGNCITTANDRYNMHNIDVIGNIASHCGADQLDHGIYVSHPHGIVANNIAYDNAGYGIHCWHNCNALDISNNLVFGNGQGGIVIGQGDEPNNGRVNADNFIVSNNIAVNNGRDGIRESGATGSKNQFLNNILWNNGTQRINVQTAQQRGTVVADPEFVNFRPDGSGDYHLRPGSPGLGAGVQLGAPATDIDGKPRPPDGRVDIGVYQQ